MKFTVAEKKMAKIANGRYHSLRFERTMKDNETIETECRLYLDPSISAIGKTWDEAFDKLDARLNPQNHPPVYEESPNVQDVTP